MAKYIVGYVAESNSFVEFFDSWKSLLKRINSLDRITDDVTIKQCVYLPKSQRDSFHELIGWS